MDISENYFIYIPLNVHPNITTDGDVIPQQSTFGNHTTPHTIICTHIQKI